MSMPIQRQSEQFGVFDTGPRWERDRSQHELPRGLAGLVNSMGPRISSGLLNTRTAGWNYPEFDRTDMDDYDHSLDRPSAADFVEEDFERERKRNYPRGQGPAWNYDEDGDPDPYLEHLEETSDPERFISGSRRRLAVEEDYSGGDEDDPDWIREKSPRQQEHNRKRGEEISRSKEMFGSRHPFDRAAARRLAGEYDDLPPLPDDFHVPDSPEGQPDRSPGWLHRQFVGPHKDVWSIPEHELDDRWNGVYDTLGFDDKTRQQWESARNTGKASDRWDAGLDGTLGGGVKDYLTRAPMSKEEYARHREHSQNRAKEIVDGLWNAFYPPEEEEGRKSAQNMETVNNLMASGWQPEHIHYDEDDEPYALYQHPSGWTVKDSGYNYKNIGHVATPGEAHDVINVSRYDRDGGQSYNAPFGPADAHAFIEDQLHGDPEETGGTFHYLMQNHPRIRRHKPRQAARSEWDGLPTKNRMSSRRLAEDKGSKCTCWEGYERVPGTEPCSEDSCRKESMRMAGAGIDYRNVRPGPWIDMPLYEQDPDDYFGKRPYSGPHCPDCGKPMRWVSGPTCRHGNLLVDAGWINGRPDHTDVSWEETGDGWQHSVTGCRVRPSTKFPDEWEMVAPTSSKRKPYSIIGHHADPHELMERHDRATGYALKTAEVVQRQAPIAGGFLPGHQVVSVWRGQPVHGIVTALDASTNKVWVRYHDGQHLPENPGDIQLR